MISFSRNNFSFARVARAGMPTDNDTVVCPDTLDSCYIWLATYVTYSTALTKCQALGGYPVAWSSSQEQLTVENYFSVRELCSS